MKNFDLGDIVLIKFPFTGQQNFKKRPALVLKDFGDDIIVCRITSKIYHSDYDILIEDWEASQLKLKSVVRVHKIATLEKTMVDKVLKPVNAGIKAKIRENFIKLIE
ncbi:type II toxin-antitoxin system PemK/MazF family toxin [Flavobacteriaceae bacterium 14752]|uniref:type II toxin-antitoxin system PemK/MazF family toxin n=1 Tax=Mesohalobacter salilacus TaxID=2491711 RepID=UPI000F633C2B|nr:type II toxin-antitoxin system PemK/MazF family toxin [Flavobacteriaceae bacterium 14752]